MSEQQGRAERRTAAEARLADDVGAASDLGHLTDEVLPALIARLRASRLAELEVRSDGWRVRLRRDLAAGRRPRRSGSDEERPADEDDVTARGVAAAPAVGYFVPVARLAVGQSFQAGDLLGAVDVLGIAQDVPAPSAGLVRQLFVEPGQAVEYGQPLVAIDALDLDDETSLAAGAHEGEAGARPEASLP